MHFSTEQLQTLLIDQFKRAGYEELAKKCSVEWNSRMRSAAGRAFLKEYKIQLNPKLEEFGEGEVKQTLLHEMAHLLAWNQWRHRGHGAPWRKACALLGIPEERVTHNLPLPSRRQKKKWAYQCPSCEAKIERVRKIKRAVACSACCKQYNRGRFSRKFLLQEIDLTTGEDSE